MNPLITGRRSHRLIPEIVLLSVLAGLVALGPATRASTTPQPSRHAIALQPSQLKLAAGLNKIVLSPNTTSAVTNASTSFVAVAEDGSGGVLNANVNSNTTFSISGSGSTCGSGPGNNSCQASSPGTYTVTANYSGSLGTASGTATLNVSAFGLGGYWQQMPGSGQDLAISEGANGSLWAVGTVATGGGYQIFHWNGSGWTWVFGGAVRIAVDPNGNPWVVNSSQQIYQYSNGNWILEPGSAYDVGVGANGTVDVVGTTTADGGYHIFQWSGSGWNPLGGGGTRIAVDTGGLAWVVNNYHDIWKQQTNGSYQEVSWSATDVGVGASNAVWEVTNIPAAGGFKVAHWNGSNWDAINDRGGLNVTVSTDGRPYITDSNNAILQRLGTPAQAQPITALPSPTSYDTGATNSGIVLGDTNGDGWTDAITPNGTGNNVSVLKNRVVGGGHASGALSQPPTISAAGTAVAQTVLGDFNGDGKADLAVVSGNSGVVGVMLGNGDGTFGSESGQQTIGAGHTLYGYPSLVAAADLNGDGKLDVVVDGGQFFVGNFLENAVDVLLGNGNGTFQSPVEYVTPDGGLGGHPNASGLALGDLNNDGKPDIAFAEDLTDCADGGQIWVLLNNGAGSFSNPASVASVPGLHSGAGNTLAISDLNGDGLGDIIANEDAIVACGAGGQRGISISFGTGGGAFLSPVYVSDPDATNGSTIYGDTTGIAVADMNGDGLPDVVASVGNSSANKPGLSVYLNAGAGSIASPSTAHFIPTATYPPVGLALADLNGDGASDIAIENGRASSPSSPALTILLNGTDFPPLGSALAAGEMHGCAMCQAEAGGGALRVSGQYPITVNSGEMSHTLTDISIPARGYSLAVTQTYNSLTAGADHGFGFGWTSSLLTSLDTNTAGIVTVSQEDGAQAQFDSGTLRPLSPRTQATLVHNADGTWTYTRYHRDTFTFNSSGQITKVANLTGDSQTFGYTSGQVTSVTHSDGRSLSVAWSGGHISSITDSNVSGTIRKVAFTYDASSQLTDIDWTVNSANDRNEHFEYASPTWTHGLTGMRDPRGNWVTQVYDLNGMTISQTVDPSSKDPNGLNRTTSYSYTVVNGAVTQALITDPKGNQELDTFASGELAQKILGYGTSSAATWSYAYDPSSLGTSQVTDPNGHVTTASYDTYGNPLVEADALGRLTTYSYSGNGGADAQFNQPTTMTDGNGVTTTYSYDTTYRTLTQTSTPLLGSSPAVNQVIQYQHTNASHPGDLTKMIDGDGKSWTYGYDSYGDRSSVTAPPTAENAGGDKTQMSYNADGWVLSTISPKGDSGSVCVSPCSPSQFTTSYTYTDSSGNTNFWGLPVKITDPLGHTIQKVYDGNNNVTQLTDGDGNLTQYAYDPANELTVTTRADAGHTTVKTDYNPDGTIADQVNGAGNVIQSYGYNSLAQQTSVTVDPGVSPHLNLTTNFGYDGAGNVHTKQNPSGSCTGTLSGCTTYSYDAANELTSISYSDGTTANVGGPNPCPGSLSNPSALICYDQDGQRTAMTDGSGTWSWSWDSLHRLTAVSEGSSGSLAYQYNLRDLPTQITYPGSHNLGQGYDDAGRLSSVTDWNGAVSNFKYDPNSNLSEADLASGTTLKDTYGYNNADQLTSIADSPSVFSATHTRDGNGQVSSDSSATSNQGSYAYTQLNQLCYAGSSNTAACSTPPSGAQPFAYNSADDLTTIGNTTQSFNSADRLTASGSKTYAYDNRGNRTTLTNGSAVTNYGYDLADRLCWTGPTSTGAACNASAQSGDTVYCYNGEGLRMAKVSAGSCAAPTTSESFLWDASGSLPLLLVDGGTDYVYGPGGLPLEQINGSSTLWYHHDQIGWTRAITNASGAVQASYTFDPYGNLSSSTGTVSNPFRFAGQYFDSETGFYYLRARYYDPATGQFISRDPLAATTRQPYAYVSDNPLNSTDPSGLVNECGPNNCGNLCPPGVWCGGDASGWDNAKANLAYAYDHTVVGYGGCAIGCAQASFQGGDFSVSVGGYGIMEKGPYVGWANLAPGRRQPNSLMGAVACQLGLGGSLGLDEGLPYPHADTTDWEIDGGTGTGFQVGVMHQVVDIKLSAIWNH